MPTVKETIENAKHRMESAIETVRKELASLRAGRANAAMLDSVKVDYYGTMTPLNQVGNIAVPDPALITIQPWDAAMVAVIEKGRIAIFAAGTGNPYFSTDTAAALRATEIKAEVILKGTRVDGVYDMDPLKFPQAKKFAEIKYIDVIQRGLKVMDKTAISLAMENKLPIIVYNIKKKGFLKRVLMGEKMGTLVCD